MFRSFVLALTLLAVAEADLSAQTLTQRIDALQILGGHLPGAYIQNRGAAGVVWYFSTIGAQSVALDGHHDRQVRAYVNAYLSTATRPGGAINDVHNLTVPTIEWKLSDSDDSYAAGILSLASWLSIGRGGDAWFRSHLEQLKLIATANLVDAMDPTTNLTLTFNQYDGRFTAPLPVGIYHAGHSQDVATKLTFRKIGQLMDNCEAYRGLDDFAKRLAAIKDPDAPLYRKAADTIAKGVLGLFDSTTGAFRVNTTGEYSPLFYPSRFVQVAPQLFGVPLGADTEELYAAAWSYLNATKDQWWNGEIADGSPRGAPLMMLAYAAALRGEREKSRALLAYFEERLSDPATPPEFASIAELGWALHVESRK